MVVFDHEMLDVSKTSQFTQARPKFTNLGTQTMLTTPQAKRRAVKICEFAYT